MFGIHVPLVTQLGTTSVAIFMDGTFSVPPHPFKLLCTIRVPFKDVTGTAVYAFLPNKCQDTYRELFQSIV
jgi:hypothetical protein